MNVHRVLRTAFASCSVVVLVFAAYQLRNGIDLNTDLNALLPDINEGAVVDTAYKRLHAKFGDKAFLGVRAPSASMARKAMTWVEAERQASNLPFSPILDLEGALSADHLEPFINSRFHLLTNTQRNWLSKGRTQPVIRRAAARLTGISASPSGLPLHKDPLNLFTDYLNHFEPKIPGSIEQDHLLIETDSHAIIIKPFQVDQGTLGLKLHEDLRQFTNTLRQRFQSPPFNNEVHLIRSGMVFHAAHASTRARAEASLIGTISVIAIFVLFLTTFRSATPLILTLGSILFGCLVAGALTLAFFSDLHIITLVFGAGLIGVSVDYSLHYASQRQEYPTDAPDLVLKRLLPALSLALGTSVLGYSCLLQADMDALREIAFFSAFGLSGSWLFVVAVYPMFRLSGLASAPRWQNRIARIPGIWIRSRSIQYTGRFVPVVLVLGAILTDWHFVSDIRSFYKPAEELKTSERLMREHFPQHSINRFYYVEGNTPNATLKREERFRRTHLPALRDEGAFTGYQAISELVPSKSRQRSNYALQRKHLYGADGAAWPFLRSAGIGSETIAAIQERFSRAEDQLLDPTSALDSLPDRFRSLWLGKIGERYVSVIRLSGIQDPEALARAASGFSGVSWHDRVQRFSQWQTDLLREAAGTLAVAFIAVFLVLWLWFRRLADTRLVVLPLVSIVGSLVVIQNLFGAVGIFHVFGCFLVFGLGMDYAIFARHEGPKALNCQRAITLSAATSALSFGLMALSSTPMVNAFGITVFLGSLFNWFFYPLFSTTGPQSASGGNARNG